MDTRKEANGRYLCIKYLFSVCTAGYGGTASPDATGCTQCTAGTIKATAGNAACTPCAAGEGSAAPFTVCAACGPDEYSANAGDPCTACVATTETTDTATGQTECSK